MAEHHHSHVHHGGPGHAHDVINYDRAFAIGLVLNVGFVVVEVAFGILSNSIALLADAGHNLSDVLALLLAWGAVALGRRQSTMFRTYGWGRSTILAAVANAVMLLVVVGAISWEALGRFADPDPVSEVTMIWVAGLGVVVNTATALLFLRGRRGDVNLRGAFLHMASDAGSSAGVVAGGVAIAATGSLWIDPLLALVISVVILLSTWGLLRDSLNLALDAVPSGVDPAEVRHYLGSLPDVREIHDLHIWAMSSTETALTAHLVVPNGGMDDARLAGVAEEVHERFGIGHVTLQIERGDPTHPCPLMTVHVA